MNTICISGRLTRDPETAMTASQTAYCRFTVAVPRPYKDANGQKQADFIPCVAWKSKSGIVAHYFKKGDIIGVTGQLQSRSYEDQNGKKRTAYEVLVNEIDFGDKKPESSEQKPAPATKPDMHEELAPDVDEGEIDISDLPFEL